MNDIEQSESLNYLHTYSDKEIISIVVNQKEWTEKEIELAEIISDQRGLSEQLEIAIEKKNKQKNEKIARNRAFVFLMIAVLWVTNIYIGREGEFLLGFGIQTLFETLSLKIILLLPFGQYFYMLILLLVFPAFYVWVWLKSKELNKTIYLIGIIVYGFDTIYFMIYEMRNSYIIFTLLGITLHLFILRLLYRGYKALVESKKNTQKNRIEIKSAKRN